MERKKRVYNIILNSKDTATYTGTKSDAQYFADLTNLVEPDALNSSYLVRFRIKSLLMNDTKYTPQNNLVVLNLGLSSKNRNMYNSNQSRIAGVLTFNWESQITTTTNNYSIDTSSESNPPMYVENLSSSLVINFNLYDVNNSSNFSNVADYVCILSFIEQ